MFRRIWYWLNEVRYFDVPVPQFIYKMVNRKALLEEARIRMELMKEEIIRKRLIDYFETVDQGQVDIMPALKAEAVIKQMKKSGAYQEAGIKLLNYEVA